MKNALLLFLLVVLGTARVSAQAIATLRAGDSFELKLGGVPIELTSDYNGQYTVSQEGNVNLAFIGDVHALGLTPPQLEKSIQTKMVAEKIFTHPAVNINLIQNSRYVIIGGGVRAPGRQMWSNDLTLNSAVKSAGGLSDFGSAKGCRLIRDGKVAGTYDLRQLDKAPENDPKLLPGDQVVVRE